MSDMFSQARNVVFYFSGTGNSLKVAKEIAAAMPGTVLFSIGSGVPPALGVGVESVGFVFPNYFMGVPAAVQRFAEGLDAGDLQGKYLYAVTTHGGSAANCLRGFAARMKAKGLELDYGASLKMFSNYVLLYDMKEDVDGITAKSNADMRPIIDDIAARHKNKIGGPLGLYNIITNNFVKSAPDKDKGYHISDSCTGCGICEKLCPVNNIRIENGKPAYSHRCEVCVACIQYCPERAIDYKNLTQKRGRYHHPDISAADFIKARGSGL
ncbi:MAG: EFR1 family ferrodoxin [Clostridiales bacterium]|nr:EFR1 family ferrodoxin [Clostridiales bacterium]